MSQSYSDIKIDNHKKSRITWVDYAKGIGIFLVVFGHVLRGLISSSILNNSGFVLFVDQWIYSFHMPLFFLLSGLFIDRSTYKPLGDFILNRCKIIVYPYFLWSIIQSLIQILSSRYTNTKVSFSDLWQITYQPIMQFWFLYVLFLLMMLYVVARKLGVSPQGFLILSLILYGVYVAGINLGSWGVIYQVCNSAVYFAVGAVLGSEKTFYPTIDGIKSKILLILTITGFTAIALGVQLNFTQIKLATVFLAFLGIIASCSLAIILERIHKAKILKGWGELSLEIYVAHTIPLALVRIILQKILKINDPAIHLVLGTLAGIYGPIALVILTKRLNFKYMFTLASR